MKKFRMENGTVIEKGETYIFADLWSGKGDEEEILESGSVWIGDDENDMPIVADFEIVAADENNIIFSTVKVTDIA